MPATKVNLNGIDRFDLNLFGTTTVSVAAGDTTITQTVSPANLPITNTPAIASKWFNSYSSTTGTYTQTQPAFSDISGTVAATQLPNPTTSTLGGIKAVTAVAHQWVNSISTTGVPSLTQPAFTDISGTVAAAQLPAPTATTLGGVESIAAVASKWVNSISTAGIPSLTQPATADISGLSASLALLAPLASPTFTGTATVRHLAAGGSAPTIVVGAGAGTGGTVAISGTDTTGIITVTTGTSPAVSVGIFTATFAAAFGVAPNMFINAANADGTIVTLATAERTAALSGVQAVCVNATTTQFAIIANGTALAASTTYAWQYLIVQP